MEKVLLHIFVCVRARARARVREDMRIRACVRSSVCVCVCVCVCVFAGLWLGVSAQVRACAYARVGLLTHYTTTRRHIIFVLSSSIIFSTLSHKRHNFRKSHRT
jgi:hypothetical protein